MAISTSNENAASVQKVQELPYQQVNTNESKLYLVSKRILDFVFAVIGIVFLSPLFLIVALLIKIEDKQGPIFFKQIRIGKDGKEFYMYKFRSMVSNAEELKAKLIEKNEATGPVFKMKNDPRVTKIGRFIRKTSIDELPQLLNVLKGQMSLVGPRPALPDEVAHYSIYEKQRLTVTPGLTCYWQVSGRSSLSFGEWVELDIKYINERSIIVDIKLIFKTVLVLFGSKNAY
ncbi:sugar transferase [Caldibacillus lycopersici]|uniref:Sugar transferase n=1 Tax=Perspicuibacillus lycopersici TaxID=1325689 RepID=A0AAE3LMV9_9BACI|nr:sugar transferase [Perspicuibacillus lycopersici]MCU9613197.1 sugar transferase [Perspicuibacillus lycopersici]